DAAIRRGCRRILNTRQRGGNWDQTRFSADGIVVILGDERSITWVSWVCFGSELLIRVPIFEFLHNVIWSDDADVGWRPRGRCSENKLQSIPERASLFRSGNCSGQQFLKVFTTESLLNEHAVRRVREAAGHELRQQCAVYVVLKSREGAL